MMNTHVVIIGAGPAGLTAAYLLSKNQIPVTLLEADPDYVGGIARTVKYKDYCFDIGGHRFFSKSAEIEALWSELLPNDLIERPRSSRIFYAGQFFAYPLKPLEALFKLGIIESAYCALSYLKAKIFPIKAVISFEDWVTNHFGKRLFNIFFKSYTEKVWGMNCNEISADWAKQRIKDLSFFSAIINAIFPKKNEAVIKTLINTFRYPRKGPGMLWEACAQKVRENGGTIVMGEKVVRIAYENNLWQVSCQEKTLSATHIISSAPLRDLVTDYLENALSHEIYTAARKLTYRDFLIVALIVVDENQFEDNWIYIHDKAVDVARIQNFKSWSPEMVPDSATNCFGMEYFFTHADALDTLSDEVLIAKAKRELIYLKLAKPHHIIDGCVVRQPKAYPVYDRDYQQNVELIRKTLEEQLPTLHLVGRNGMHKYNNQDHAMMTAMLTVKNILAGKRIYDTWGVNQDAQYLEKGDENSEILSQYLREVPRKV